MSRSITRREALKRCAGLLGGLVSMPALASVLSSCSGGPDWTPVAFSSKQREIVTVLAELILPETDTPGAIAAGVPRFIDTMVGEALLDDDRTRFLDGIDAFDTRCVDTYGTPFLESPPGEQVALLGEVDEETFGPGAEPIDPEAPSFYVMLKQMTLVGYYTSEIGATQELQLNLVPGRYDGNVPVDEVGRAWAQ